MSREPAPRLRSIFLLALIVRLAWLGLVAAAHCGEGIIALFPDSLRYHGLAEYMLGQRDLATKNLTAFLRLYHENDGWRANGITVLERLRSETPADLRRPAEPR